MVEITVRMKDKDKAQKLLDFLSIVDFVEIVEVSDEENLKIWSQTEDGWPKGFFEEVIGGWEGEPLHIPRDEG